MLLNRETLHRCLNELAKEYKKSIRNKRLDAPLFEIIVVGGSAIVEAYSFRATIEDVDAIGTIFKNCIKNVANKLNLNDEWLNDSFKQTESYSNRLTQYSTFHKTFLNVLNVRLIKREYLVAMKLKSFRNYKNDLSDILGILIEESKTKPITLEEIKRATTNLYGSYEKSLSNESRQFIEKVINKSINKIKESFQNVLKEEKATNAGIFKIQKINPNVLNKKNVTEAVKKIKDNKSAEEIIKELNDIQNKK